MCISRERHRSAALGGLRMPNLGNLWLFIDNKKSQSIRKNSETPPYNV